MTNTFFENTLQTRQLKKKGCYKSTVQFTYVTKFNRNRICMTKNKHGCIYVLNSTKIQFWSNVPV